MKTVVEVDKESLDKLLRKLSPELYKEGVKGMMQEAAGTGEGVMREAIRGGTDFAMQSIGAKAYPMEARVYSAIPRARGLNIEGGRSPGDAPGYLATARWLTGRRHLTGRRLSELPDDLVKQVIAAREAILARGARGKYYLRATHDALQNALPELLNNLSERIKGKWGGI